MDIGFNKYQVYGNISILIIISSIVGIFIFYSPKLNFPPFSFSFQVVFIIILWFFLFLILFLMVLQLIFLPNGVKIDIEQKSLIITYFLWRSTNLQIADVVDYSTTTTTTKSTNYEGILIHLKNGKTYFLSDYNLANYKPIMTFLEDCKVNFGGHKKIWFVPIFNKS